MTANILGLGSPIVDYGTVVTATRVTFTKLAKQAFPEASVYVNVDTKGGSTARVTWDGHPTARLHISLSMPSLPAFFRVPRAYAERLVGYLVHELQHVRKSDVDGLKGKEPLLANLINGLEDCRIEAELIKDGSVPNARVILSDLAQALLAEALAAGWTLDTVGALPFGAAILGRHCLGHDLQLAGLRIGSQFEPALAMMRARLGACRSTTDIATLAADMLKSGREEAAKQPKTDLGKPKGDTKGDDQGDQGDDQGDDQGERWSEPSDQGDDQGDDQGEGWSKPSDQGDDQGDQGDQGKGDQGNDQGDQGNDQGDQGKPQDGDQGKPQDGDQGADGKPSRKRGAASERSTRSADHEKALKDLVETIVDRNDITAQRLRKIPEHIRDWQGAKDMPVMPYDLNENMSVSEAHALVPQATMVREHVRRLLKAPAQAMRQHYRPHGRLDRRAFTRMALDAQNVFTKKTRADAVNTAVGLLLDNSGSMGHIAYGQTIDRNACQKALAIVLAEACKHADVDCHISTFGHGTLVTVKDWRTPLPVALATIGQLGSNMGHTPLAACMMAAVDKLATRTNRTKRILLVLTDGDAGEGQDAMNLAQDYAKSKDVRVIGVQIGSEAADAFRVGVGVVDPSKLSQEVLGALLGELRKAWVAR